MTVTVLAIIASTLRIVELLLEATPPDIRERRMIAWFWITWPTLKVLLKLSKAPKEFIEETELLVKEIPRRDTIAA